MTRKSTSLPKPKKRGFQDEENGSSEEYVRKPRKVVKKNKQVSHQQNVKKNQSPLNFYETISEVPTYHLSKQQMKGDPIELLNRLQEKFGQYGAVKIGVNQSWNAPFTFRYIDKQITTRIQCLQRLKDGKAFEQKVRAYRIQGYQAMAHTFSRQYRYKTNPKGSTQESMNEDEYWNLVANPQCNKRPVTVQYAADLSASVYGSGFPVQKMMNWIDADFQYESNYWNLNNISKSPSSLLQICQKRKQKISGVSFPWVYMGMKFSTFCWHVEDLFLNSLNYNHKGSTKTWYVVPGSYKQKFDDYVQRKFQGNSKKKNILEKIILMIDPKELIKEGIQVYKANQRPRQYVCTFIKAYHAGFSHGFNVGQAVNFISPRSLSSIYQGQIFYHLLEKSKGYKPKAWVLSKQWLIYENIEQGIVAKFGVKNQCYLQFQYQKMIRQEQFYLKDQLVFKKKLDSINSTKKVNILPIQTKYEKMSCSHCKNYIYLSAISCNKCGILCQYHITKCECGPGANKYEIWIREPNQDRLKTLQEYPVILKALQEFRIKQKKQQYDLSRGRSQGKGIREKILAQSVQKPRLGKVVA